MPIYDMKCSDCGNISEILTITSNQNTYQCPQCGSVNMERLISSSYMIKMGASRSEDTCCGRAEPCQAPQCSQGGCWREQ